MDLDKVKSFYWVAQLGNITQAAHRLNTTQSALSRTIINLEDRLGVKLFKRISRGVEITEDGKFLFEFAKKMVTEADAVERFLRNSENEVKGDLNLLTTTTIASASLIPHLPDFLEQHPDLKLNILTNDEETTLKNADLAIRPYMHDYPELIQRLLTTFHMRLFASKEYLEKFGVPRSPSELDKHQLLIYGGEKIFSFWNINWLLTLGRSPRNPREPYMRLNSSHGLLKAAKHGLGIVCLGKDYPRLENIELIEVLPEIEAPTVEIFAIYPRQFKTVRRVTAFVDFLEEKFNS